MTGISGSTAERVLDDIRGELVSFTRHLDAENRSLRTIESYGETVAQFTGYLENKGMPLSARAIRQEHIEAYLANLKARGRSPATVALRYRSLRVFFGFLVDVDVIPDNPMRKIDAPSVPERDVPVLSGEDVSALLKATDGKSFEQRRDRALVMLFIDTGARLSEIADLRIGDVDLDKWIGINIRAGKGDKQRFARFGKETRRALDLYERARRNHPRKDLPWYWLGKRGRLESRGIVQIFKRRATQAGVADFHVHRTRHTWAHNMKSAGMSDGDLMLLGGWSSPTMLRLYGKSVAGERARAAYEGLSPIDSLRRP